MAPSQPQKVPDPHWGPFHPLNPLGPLSPINPGNIGGAVSGAVSGTEAIGNFFIALLKPQTWVRIGEVVVGTALLIVGVDHMFGTDITGKIAKVAPYAAAL